jgi:hydroxyacylglutathione hydrolase
MVFFLKNNQKRIDFDFLSVKPSVRAREGLAHMSYILGSNKEAIVIDPRRDRQVYLDLARREEMTIRHIFEAHRNEDYVIGSRELVHFTRATIYHGPGLDRKYGETLKDGQISTLEE